MKTTDLFPAPEAPVLLAQAVVFPHQCGWADDQDLECDLQSFCILYISSRGQEIRLEPNPNWPFNIPDTPPNIVFDPNSRSIQSITIFKLIERLTHPTNADVSLLHPFLAPC